jgi:hypothetical protein
MFAKVFNQIYDSSIVENPEMRFTFMDFLVLADCNGVVDMTHEAIARRTNRPIETIRETITGLESPDLRSRSPEFDGARIKRLDEHRDWGWFIVNFDKFRKTASEEQRRERTRERVERFRANGGGAPNRWPSIRARILEMDGYICGYCQKEATEVDHIIPMSKGGDESDENLVACCRMCNVTKNNRTPEECGFILKKHRVTLCTQQRSGSNDLPSASSSPSLSKKGDTKGKGRCTQAEAEAFCESLGMPKSDGEAMFLHWEEKGWGRVKNWQATIRKWKSFGYLPSQKGKNGTLSPKAPIQKGVNVW